MHRGKGDSVFVRCFNEGGVVVEHGVAAVGSIVISPSNSGWHLPQFSDRLNANAPSGLAPAAKPLRVSLADYAASGQYV